MIGGAAACSPDRFGARGGRAPAWCGPTQSCAPAWNGFGDIAHAPHGGIALKRQARKPAGMTR